MRGKVQRQRMHARARRITPAYAGKSSRPLRPPECRKDHPRVCGEKQKKSPTGLVTRGSPPACAGKRRGSCRRMHRIWDHPRVCGEKRWKTAAALLMSGSPPHVRGKVGAAGLNNLIDGITPACAGKSLSGHTSKSGMKDHPRMCGEKTKKIP